MLHVRGPGCCPLIPWLPQQDPQLLMAAVSLKGVAASPSAPHVLTFSFILIFMHVCGICEHVCGGSAHMCMHVLMYACAYVSPRLTWGSPCFSSLFFKAGSFGHAYLPVWLTVRSVFAFCGWNSQRAVTPI